jgi:hypothetical protein
MFHMKQILSGIVATVILIAQIEKASADSIWNNNNGQSGADNRNWSYSSNWIYGLPNSGTNVKISEWALSADSYPIVSTMGNTANQVYLNLGATLSVVNGGSLLVNSYITGQWNNTGVTDVSGGLLQTGSLLLGNGGYDGKLNISGGNVFADYLSINVGGGALMNIGTNGTFVAASSNLGNINYWINNNAIRAENGAAGWAINVDTASQAGKVVLTAVNVASIPEPSTFATLGTGLVLLCATRSLRRRS